MIGLVQYLGAKVCDAILENWKGVEMLFVQRFGAGWCGVERPVGQNGEWAMGAPHALDGIQDVMERRYDGGTANFFRGNVSRLLGRKTVSPVKRADRVYSEDGYFLVWHARRVVGREIRDRSGELNEGRRTK